MSLPTPHIQALSTYRDQGRKASLRNISSPYSLAIPPNRTRRAKTASTISSIPYSIGPTSIASTSSDDIKVPSSPKKAFIVSQKSLLPYSHSSVSLGVYEQYGHASPYTPVPKKSRFRELFDDRILALSVTLTLGVILAIAIPLGIILPQKLAKPLPVNVIIPLNVYPSPGAWDPMFDAFIKYHETKFLVIVNPDNGPGSNAWPSTEYLSAVKALHRHQNVQALGYIDTASGKQNQSLVRAEIARYAGWFNQSAEFGLHGIYFDHTPWKFDNETQLYLRNLSSAVRHAEGFHDGVLVAHNPGRVPDDKVIASLQPNITVVYEGVYTDMPRADKLHEMLNETTSNRQMHALFVNSVPSNLGRPAVRRIVEDVRKEVQWLYLTDLVDAVYSSYGSLWTQWLDLVF